MTPKHDDAQRARIAREVTARAAKRLDWLEWLILGGAVVAAIGGGALVAFLVAGRSGLPFRLTWMVSAVLLFVVPGSLALRRARKEERAWREKMRIDKGQEPDV